MTKKKLPKAKKKPDSKLSQKERFIEYAKQVGVDESGEEFERAFGSVIKKKPLAKTDTRD